MSLIKMDKENRIEERERSHEYSCSIQKVPHTRFNPMAKPFYPANWALQENNIRRMPTNTFSQVLYQYQKFQHFVVIDFEATCDKEEIPDPQEIIEFPSILVNGMTGQVEASFQTYVRPTYHQLLSDFCKELTGIEQAQVDTGVMLSKAILMHDKWLKEKGVKNTDFAVVTWTNWDCKVMLDSECKLKRIVKPSYFNRWINLKAVFQKAFGVRCSLKEAVELAGLTWEGHAHCGLDDAKNTAHLLAHIMHLGFRLSITNSLTTGDFMGSRKSSIFCKN